MRWAIELMYPFNLQIVHVFVAREGKKESEID